MKIAVVGIGYVGTANAILLSQKHDVVAFDIDPIRVDKINHKIAPIADEGLSEFLRSKELSLSATLDEKIAFSDADYIIIATPTNYSPEKKYMDTGAIETVIRSVRKYNKAGIIVIKSTIPVGYIKQLTKDAGTVLFSPEFLREGRALYDNLHPSRIIVGGPREEAKKFAELLKSVCEDKDVPVLLMGTTEAEAVKLFANSYLAMRVAFFNEIDTYAEIKKLNSADIIAGVCMDSRIGNYYNNPSFGYGGYCLPKDTKQLLANFEEVPSNMIGAIVNANDTRMDFIASTIMDKKPEVIGIYQLAMKKDSDNFRQSAMIGILERLKKYNVKIVLFEPLLKESSYDGYEVLNDLDEFKRVSNIILANRYENEIADVQEKVYCRDIFYRD